MYHFDGFIRFYPPKNCKQRYSYSFLNAKSGFIGFRHPKRLRIIPYIHRRVIAGCGVVFVALIQHFGIGVDRAFQITAYDVSNGEGFVGEVVDNSRQAVFQPFSGDVVFYNPLREKIPKVPRHLGKGHLQFFHGSQDMLHCRLRPPKYRYLTLPTAV